MKSQLQDLGLLDRPAALIICQPLVHALLDGISRRFDTVFDDLKAQLAAASSIHPKFKLDWLENPVQKSVIAETCC